MMDLVKLLAWLFMTALVGWSALSLIPIKKKLLSIAERLSFAYGLGLGLISCEMAVLSWVRVPFTPFNLLIWPLPLIAIAGIIDFKNRRPVSSKSGRAPAARLSPMEKFFVCGISFEIFYAFFRALIKPMEAYDAIAIYALKAKMFYLAKGIPPAFFHDFKDFVPHIEYPLLIPLAEAYVYTFLGALNDLLVKCIFPFYYIALLCLTYGFIRRFLERKASLFFTFLLATIPQFKEYATIGYADLPLAFYYSASFFSLYLWMRDRSAGFLVLSFLCSIFALWTKAEGVMLAGINIFIAVLSALRKDKQAQRLSLFYALSLSAVLVFYLIIQRLCGLALHSDFGKLGLHIGRIPAILYEYQIQFFGPKKWNIFWILCIIAFAVGFKKAFKDDMAPATLAILFILCGYAGVYMISPQEIGWQLSTTASRLFLHFLPVAVVWLALLFKEEKLDL